MTINPEPENEHNGFDLTYAMSVLHNDDLKKIVELGFTYLSIMWSRMEVVDSHGVRIYKLNNPPIITSKHGKITSDHSRFIVKSMKVTEIDDQVYIEIIEPVTGVTGV